MDLGAAGSTIEDRFFNQVVCAGDATVIKAKSISADRVVRAVLDQE
jgi:hypothetical protein